MTTPEAALALPSGSAFAHHQLCERGNIMSGETPGSGPTPEHLEMSGGTPFREPRPRGRGRRRAVIAGGTSLGLVAAVGAGVWAWQAWVAQGPQPSEALPGNTLAYVAIDLDPPGGQKLEALDVIRSFPALKKELGLDTDDDVRRSVVEEFTSEGSCELDYAKDVAPWIGDRAALAVVDQNRPQPVVVLQVNDADKARGGLDSLSDCGPGSEVGYVIDGDWAVLAASEKIARMVVDDAANGTLADDSAFKDWTSAAGDPGVVTLYAAPEAGPALLAEIDRSPYGYVIAETVIGGLDPMSMLVSPFLFMGALSPSFDEPHAYEGEVSDGPVPGPEVELTPAEQAELEKQYADEEYEEEFEEFPEPELPAALRDSLENFSGLGGVVRFEHGGVELELVSDRLEGTMGSLADGTAGDDVVSGLPDSTAIAFGTGFGEGWADELMVQLTTRFSYIQRTPEETVADFERGTGLDVPADLEALGGESVSLSAGEGIDPEQAFESPELAPVAARIKGDPDRIEAALDKLRVKLPAADAGLLLSRRVGDDVLVGANAAYLDRLAEGGDLGGTDRFRGVAPDAADSMSVLFIDFDAGDWLVESTGNAEERANTEPLDALGYTRWADGDRERTLLRLTVED